MLPLPGGAPPILALACWVPGRVGGALDFLIGVRGTLNMLMAVSVCFTGNACLVRWDAVWPLVHFKTVLRLPSEQGCTLLAPVEQNKQDCVDNAPPPPPPLFQYIPGADFGGGGGRMVLFNFRSGSGEGVSPKPLPPLPQTPPRQL